ncbi:hypothetical protein M569_17063, partial [Genlisea aurea]
NRPLAEACRFVHNDAKLMNERARNDIILLARGLEMLNARAQNDVAFLSSEFLKMDVRAREDTEKIDNDVKERAQRLRHIAFILKSKAQISLKTAADKHWNDGALEADLKRADVAAKKRALEDSLMALELVKSIHEMMVRKMKNNSVQNASRITVEKNGRTFDLIPGKVSPDRIAAIE